MRNTMLVFAIVALGGVLMWFSGDIAMPSLRALISVLSALAFFIGVFA